MKPDRLLAAAGLLVSLPVIAVEFKAELGLQTQLFTQQVVATHQSNFSVSLQPTIKHQLSNKNIYLTFTAFARLDQYDDARNHSDIRELNIISASGDWEFEAGISKVFWGVAEANHLVDIINQTDYLENIDGEDKLGQPMLRVSKSFAQSTLSAFILPWFRERDYLGKPGRFALPFPVSTSDATYQSSNKEKHVDYALRYSGYRGQLDYGLSWFVGTSRNAQLLGESTATIHPYYSQIKQAGLDIQYTAGAWLWKLEAIRQKPRQNQHSALVAGLEYTFYSRHDGLYDLGLLTEYNYDSRDDAQSVLLQNDLFIGARLGFNDTQSSSVLVGAIHDLDDQSRSLRIEANRRIFDDASLTLEAQIFSHVDNHNLTYSMRDNDFIQFELAWFF